MVLPDTETVSGQLKMVIIEPLGPQGPKLGLGFSSKEQFQKFDEVVGLVNPDRRRDLQTLRDIAHELGIPIIKP